MKPRLTLRTRRSFWGVAVVCVVLPYTVTVLLAQEKPPGKADEKTEFAEFLGDARRYVIRTTKPEALLKLHEPSVLNFTNPERNQERGSVFVWLHEDRPAVSGAISPVRRPNGRVRKYALHSLAAGPLEAKVDEKTAWAPDQPGVVWKSFPDAPAAAATDKGRRLQMKRLAGTFKVNLIDPKERSTELRLAPHPLYEYSAPRAGVTEGAIFSFLVATDPEAVLLVEAFEENGKTGFRYAFARFHFWQLTAALGDTTVWDVAFDPSMLNNTSGHPATVNKVYNSFIP